MAETGQQGLEEANGWRPEVVLLDFHLPDLDATEWLRRFRSAPLPMVPVVVCTADLEIPTDECEPLGATLISKLCDMDQICYALELACSPAAGPDVPDVRGQIL
jgi:CheY-like chemotaxis protein